MMATTLWRTAIVVLIAVTAGCDYDASSPEQYAVPAPDVNEGLWVASGNSPAILRLSPPQLLSSGRLTASATLTTSSAALSTFSSLAFDAAGTMWVASAEDTVLLAFSPEALARSGSSVASTVIAPAEGSLSTPTAIAFDQSGRLWVANFNSETLVRFDPAQLVAGGAPRPTVVIEGLGRPTAVAFDASGSLWVANAGTNTLVKYSGAQLEASGSPRPQIVLSDIEGSLAFPFALAFDPFGNLWVANLEKRTIVSFGPAKLGATGSPVPDLQIAAGAGSFDIPIGLAFDGQGSLWVVDGEAALFKFDRTTLLVTGEPEPSVELFPAGHTLLSGVAFWPTPAGLPIN